MSAAAKPCFNMPPISALAMLPPPRKVIFMRGFFHQKWPCRCGRWSRLRLRLLQDRGTCPWTRYRAASRPRGSVAKISRSRRNGARWAAKSSAGSGMAIRPRKFSRGKAAIAWHSAKASIGRATALAGFAGDIHLDTDLQWRQLGRTLCRQAFGDLEALDRMHPGEMFGNQARLVALQRADEMPLQIEVDRGPCLVDRLLHVILAECPLSGPVRGNHALDRPCLADCQKTYFPGQTTRVDSCFGDT